MIMRPTRREFLKYTSSLAAAATLGTVPGLARAQRENELNIYCWEGYNSDDVLDPFRREFNATVRAEGLTSDPDAVNKLRGGETKIWDLINVNNPWAREMMWPEGLMKDIPRDRFEPFFEKMMPEFHPPYPWAMDKTGEYLLGVTQRFGPFNFVVNTDKISRSMAEDQGFKLFLDPAMKDRYGVLTYDNWNIYHMCVAADVHPFKEHTAAEIASFGEVAKQVFNGAKILTDDLVAMNLALINGEIDAYFTGGTYTASPARYDGFKNVRGITPASGPMDGKGVRVMGEPGNLLYFTSTLTLQRISFLFYRDLYFLGVSDHDGTMTSSFNTSPAGYSANSLSTEHATFNTSLDSILDAES